MSASNTLDELIRDATRRLSASSSARLDARLLMMEATGFDPGELIAFGNTPIDRSASGIFHDLLERRVRHEPMAYILGTREFWGEPYHVTPDVLIPRPDSETLIDAALRRRKTATTILDLGTGSGCLLGALLKEYPEAIGIGVDYSAAAACIAQENLFSLGRADRSVVIQGSWCAPIQGPFDIIVTNPPYIDPNSFDDLPTDVRDFEPYSALFSPDMGRADYRHILAQVRTILQPGGLLIIEIGDGQATYLRQNAAQHFPEQQINIEHDLAGHPRALIIDYAEKAAY